MLNIKQYSVNKSQILALKDFLRKKKTRIKIRINSLTYVREMYCSKVPK